eukprot:scaffold72784_cov51-Phaeocystis_antarctica.AAC.1
MKWLAAPRSLITIGAASRRCGRRLACGARNAIDALMRSGLTTRAAGCRLSSRHRSMLGAQLERQLENSPLREGDRKRPHLGFHNVRRRPLDPPRAARLELMKLGALFEQLRPQQDDERRHDDARSPQPRSPALLQGAPAQQARDGVGWRPGRAAHHPSGADRRERVQVWHLGAEGGTREEHGGGGAPLLLVRLDPLAP